MDDAETGIGARSAESKEAPAVAAVRRIFVRRSIVEVVDNALEEAE